MEHIPYGRQSISAADINAVCDVLKSDFLTQGPVVPRFEQAVADYCGVAHGVAVNSSTSALHLACLALEVGPGDIVWTTPITFVASSNCALYCGAEVDFVDIDPQTYNLSVERLTEKLVAAEQQGKLPKVVIPVHLCGQPCDMAAIHALSQQYGFHIIEDASHAIGSRYQGKPVGSCQFSDITVFSFHPVKIITTGEGGMSVTNSAVYAEKMRRLRSHGITREVGEMTEPPHGPWYYQQIELGFNYRMTEIQAALGLSQMHLLDTFVSERQIIASRYDEALATFPIIKRPWQHADSFSARHLYVVRVPAAQHNLVFARMRERHIGVNLHYIPVYLQPYYKDLGFSSGYCPIAESYYAEAISLPIFPTLLESQQVTVLSALMEGVAA
ncbi:UDP-4-amino-4,6-dideoxy-N-acetyl-beta-L-altrosamine transaminase [Polynucleobacter sp. MG-Unter2-18]|uniref:UDP-4-amino-4, 6-dideoxy-N-acetyl-beta-L-altrosamine transaminase n=1 Tax=Polynucleobacter sp. MG-Unter2-18 TaxID=2081052 RepID=UPI001BFD95B5|nr:UDP-4-amino-4,6-dideoxy-N-acetyl-beta-L-altrosamine transaminase [Polynucleobacter sp. MG-Unter2-18]QWD94866.1 UDP-4-amino-4,6-dideoxy-N-acetyl-beta-L-altrosamine transaminase [Polynucleobacter sp. MG-Unter2-18]